MELFKGSLRSVDITVAASRTDQFTLGLVVQDEGVMSIETTDFIGTVTLQFKNNESAGWFDMYVIAVAGTPVERYGFKGYGDHHRVGVKSMLSASNFTSGSAVLRLKG